MNQQVVYLVFSDTVGVAACTADTGAALAVVLFYH